MLLLGMDEEEIEAVVDKKKSEIKNELKEELRMGDTRIDASLGMFNLTIDSDEDLEATVEAFEEVWQGRIQELEASKMDTVREKLEDDDMILFG